MLYINSVPGARATGATQQALPANGKTVLLVSRAGHMREALLGLLNTLSELSGIQMAESGLLALSMADELNPHLVLVAGGLPEAEGPELVRQFKQRWPDTPCLVLAENARQLALAFQAGANCALPARTPSVQLLNEIVTLIATKSL